MSYTPFILLFVSILIGVVGQLLLKFATMTDQLPYLFFQFVNIYFLGAGLLYGVSFFLYAAALREIDLQIAFPSVSLSYVVVAFASHQLWGTPFGGRELLALALIMSGVTILATSQA